MGGNAEWYCHECDTYGGGSPNYVSMQAHVDFKHDGMIAEMESV